MTAKPQLNAQAARARISDSVKQKTMRMIQQDEELIAQLAPEAAPERRQYPEHEFRRHFLPIVSGEALKALPEGYTPERLLNEATNFWTNISGGLNQEVEVVEPDGTVAFIVPALMDTSIINTAQPKNDAGLRAVNHEFQQRSASLPHVAARRMEASLSEKLVYLFKDGVDHRDTDAKVKKMREYYGLTEKTDQSDSGSKQDDSFMGEMQFD